MRFVVLALVLCCGAALKQLGVPDRGTRRHFFNRVAAGLAIPSVIHDVGNPPSAAAEELSPSAESKPAESVQVYRVVPDSSESLTPSLESLDVTTFLSSISPQQGGALWLGEHHNSAKDHEIQTNLLRQLCRERRGKDTKIAVGLEQVQVQFQSVLDDFVAGKISLAEMRKGVEWDKRWRWPFEVYEPLFTAAQELSVPLVALNVDSEDLALVEKNGLPGLPRDRLSYYIPDAMGFANFASQRQFKTYVDYVIRPSYDIHETLGLLTTTIAGERLDPPMSFRNFFSGRILWDESMASRAFRWTQDNPGGLLLGLVGADHVKFQNGIPARYARMAAAGNSAACISVLLNPTLIDTRPPGSVGIEGADSTRPDRITLQLRYLRDDVDINSPDRMLPASTGGVLPLADYLVLS